MCESVVIDNQENLLWDQLDKTLNLEQPIRNDNIDKAIKTWISVSSSFHIHLPGGGNNVTKCVQKLLHCPFFAQQPNNQINKATSTCPSPSSYVRMQIIQELLREDNFDRLHVIASFLLFDGRCNDGDTYPRMIHASCFPRLIELIDRNCLGSCREGDSNSHRLMLQLIYEMAGMERLRYDDLINIEDNFIKGLFATIEDVSGDPDDPYHYAIIRVLLVLNEQYMLASTPSLTCPLEKNISVTNRVVKCLSLYGPLYKVFGENIILLLNRETETSLQLLILKLLYLLFTNRATYEYFYTNDLKVLIDVILRNLMDLPVEKMSLRHTYLRVLYPLLAHTQLHHPPQYKRDEIMRVLKLLRGPGVSHFAPTDDTTIRLIDRVANVEWLRVAHESNSIYNFQTGLSSTEQFNHLKYTPTTCPITPPSTRTDDMSNLNTDGDAPVVSHNLDHQTSDMSLISQEKLKMPPAVPLPRRNRLITHEHISSHGDVLRVGRIPPKAPPPRRLGRHKLLQSQSDLPDGI